MRNFFRSFVVFKWKKIRNVKLMLTGKSREETTKGEKYDQTNKNRQFVGIGRRTYSWRYFLLKLEVNSDPKGAFVTSYNAHLAQGRNVKITKSCYRFLECIFKVSFCVSSLFILCTCIVFICAENKENVNPGIKIYLV